MLKKFPRELIVPQNLFLVISSLLNKDMATTSFFDLEFSLLVDFHENFSFVRWPWHRVYRFFSIQNSNIVMKNAFNIKLSVYTLICPKVANWLSASKFRIRRFSDVRNTNSIFPSISIWFNWFFVINYWISHAILIPRCSSKTFT